MYSQSYQGHAYTAPDKLTFPVGYKWPINIKIYPKSSENKQTNQLIYKFKSKP